MSYVYNTECFTQENDVSYYLLGAFLTDGCMKSDRVCLSSKDRDWLESIKDLICKDLKIKKDGKNCYRLSIYNKIIREWLFSHGCIPNKSLILSVPKVPEQFLPDFLRGCIDGDGTIAHKQYKRMRGSKESLFYSTHYSLTSASKDFVDGICSILQNNKLNYSLIVSRPGTKKSKIDGRIINHKNNIYYITGGHRSAFKFLNWVYYPNHKLSLSRKKDIANKIISHYTS